MKTFYARTKKPEARIRTAKQRAGQGHRLRSASVFTLFRRDKPAGQAGGWLSTAILTLNFHISIENAPVAPRPLSGGGRGPDVVYWDWFQRGVRRFVSVHTDEIAAAALAKMRSWESVTQSHCLKDADKNKWHPRKNL